MHTSSAFVFTAIMALARVAIATPPACLIAALGAQSDPSDLTALCGTLEPVVAGNITDLCSGTSEASAISIYSASCLAAGVTVSVETASSSSGSGSASATTTGTSKATGSSTATATASAKASGTATSTATGTSASSTATGTSGAGANTSPQSALILGTLVLGFGFASYLL